MFGDHLNIPELQWPWHDRFQILKEMRQRRQRMIMLCALCYISTIHHLVAVIASAAPHLSCLRHPGERSSGHPALIYL